jgi:hypothetical protein
MSITEKLVKILADDYLIVKEQLHNGQALWLCFENHVGTLKIATLSVEAQNTFKTNIGFTFQN